LYFISVFSSAFPSSSSLLVSLFLIALVLIISLLLSVLGIEQLRSSLFIGSTA
jgi:hypothetical protein